MKSTLKRGLSGILAVLMLAGSVVAVSAHSGRTDSRGGHKDNKNKSGLGYYHYHCGGYPAHLHTNGICPYKNNSSYSDTSAWTGENTVNAAQNQISSGQQDGVIGSVVTTDIKAYINGAEIPAYNVDGNMVIIGADLRSYGFEVVYDNTARTSSVSLSADGGTWNPITVTTGEDLSIGTKVMNVYETDITMVVNGTPVTGYNVDGRMAFRFAELAVFGSYYYDNENRSSNLWIE